MFFTLIQMNSNVLVIMTSRLQSKAIMELLQLGYTIYQSELRPNEDGYVFHRERGCKLDVDLFLSDARSIHAKMKSYV